MIPIFYEVSLYILSPPQYANKNLNCRWNNNRFRI